MSRFDHDEPVEVTGLGHVTISARDPERAVRFYRRVFGFQIVADARAKESAHVLMCARERHYLVICGPGEARAATAFASFAVVDLDMGRERLWNLGVALTDGAIEPERDSSRRRRTLRILDPDGNAIELVETAAPTARYCVFAAAARSSARAPLKMLNIA